MNRVSKSPTHTTAPDPHQTHKSAAPPRHLPSARRIANRRAESCAPNSRAQAQQAGADERLYVVGPQNLRTSHADGPCAAGRWPSITHQERRKKARCIGNRIPDTPGLTRIMHPSVPHPPIIFPLATTCPLAQTRQNSSPDGKLSLLSSYCRPLKGAWCSRRPRASKTSRK
jgi:hypothetical protein